MVYFSSLLLLIALFFVESSLLPHLIPQILTPLLVLPFLSIIVLKDRTLSPIILAGVAGLLTDAIAGNIIPIYTIAYIMVVFISKVFFARFISYGESRANIINMLIGLAIIYGTELALTANNIDSLNWIFPMFIGVGLSFIALFLYTLLGRKYFSWVEKETEERYR